jgi:hypothetical protein
MTGPGLRKNEVEDQAQLPKIEKSVSVQVECLRLMRFGTGEPSRLFPKQKHPGFIHLIEINLTVSVIIEIAIRRRADRVRIVKQGLDRFE